MTTGSSPDLADTTFTNYVPPTEAELLDLMQHMIEGRIYSTRLFNLQRQGRAGTMAPTDGSEAVAAGAASALDPATDWIFPQYREQTALSRFDADIVDRIALYNMGHPAGGDYGDAHVFPFQISLACQIPHAVGMAWGMKIKGEPGVALTFFGDGSSSEGDFYEAANLAGVRKAPVIFVLINNGWAISTPLHLQTAAESFAHKAAAFGMPGVRVDGGDPLAVRAAVADARARAATGGGPTLIEAETYRLGPHTTADDPTRYVPEDRIAAELEKDPVARFAGKLTDLGLWDPDKHAAAIQVAEDRFDLAWERAEATPLHPDAYFDNVWTETSPRMERQRRDMLADLAAREVQA